MCQAPEAAALDRSAIASLGELCPSNLYVICPFSLYLWVLQAIAWLG